MSRTARIDLVFVLLVGVPVAIFLGKLFFAEQALYTDLLSDQPLVYLGSLTKLLFLFLAAWFGWKCGLGFERGNSIRPAWLLLGTGLTLFFLGQASLAPYQLFLDTPMPFPSIGDLFFLLSYVFLILALVSFIRAYEKAGLPLGSAGERWGIGVAVVAVCAVLGYLVLKPIAVADVPALEKALNLAYPGLDFVLLVPTLLLLRITLRLRGGQVGTMWLMLLTGFVLLSVGDILFAYLSALGQAHLDPLVDAMYILSYGIIARAVMRQLELVST
jgi:hypothetical protein